MALGLIASVLVASTDASMEIRSPRVSNGDQHIDILTKIKLKHNVDDRDGENHGEVKVPKGSQLITLPVGSKGEKIAVYWPTSVNNAKTEHAFVMMHGRFRDGDRYWSIMDEALKSAKESKNFDPGKEAVVVAPQMYSAKLNKGQYDDKTLAWGPGNAWVAGTVATHPKGTNLTSMDALDAILDHFSDKNAFPNMKNVTLIGHGGGAQLMNRYAATGKDPTSRDIYVRYVVGDPSSSPYFTGHRPVTDKAVANIDTCKGYNNWRYGFVDFPGTLSSKMNPKDYFGRYLNRDVVNIIGLRDINEDNGDQSCMAVLQGGRKRRDRNFSWWRYINVLARTQEVLEGFPGNFSGLPDWSDVHPGTIRTRLAIVEDASHNAEKIFHSKIGRSALFGHYEVDQGWRPDAWHKSHQHKSHQHKGHRHKSKHGH